MKRIVFALLVLMVAAPAGAEVLITCEPASPNEPNVIVSYDNSEPNSVRAFALEITVDAGEISAVSCLSDDYYLYPGSINIINGEVEDFGSCVAFIDSNVVIIEMGSLYADEDPYHTTPPPDIDDLLLVTVTEECQMCISENEIRGGVVMEDLSDPNVNAPCCGADVCPTCPTCWYCDCFPCGDTNCDCQLTFGDISILIAAWPPNPYNPCADLTQDGMMTFGDISVLIANWPPHGGCANCGTCTPIP
jgi:hypothetical protein